MFPFRQWALRWALSVLFRFTNSDLRDVSDQDSSQPPGHGSGKGPKPGYVRAVRRIPLTGLMLLLLVLAAGCAKSPFALNPASPQATRISDLFWIIFGIAAAVFLIVEGLLWFSLVHFRRRPGVEGEPAQIQGSTRVEVAWTVVPAIILGGVLVMTIITMDAVTARPSSALQVKVVGHQWWWEIQYPGQVITTATDLHVPVGQPVNVELTSNDVIHSFWVPELNGKMDVIPGHTNRTTFKADKSNVFLGLCAEFCGTQHAKMHFLVISESADAFAAWVKDQQAPPVKPSGKAAEGERIFMASACIGCHTVEGTKAQGKVGPDLTHFASRRTIAAVTLENTHENLTKWLTDPQAIKPGNDMPNLHLSDDAIEALTAYLESLR